MTYKLLTTDSHGETWCEFICENPAYLESMANDICREMAWNRSDCRIEVRDGKL